MPEQRLPFCVSANRGPKSMACSRLEDGRFHVYRAGAAPILLTGSSFILAREPLAALLGELCSGCLDLVPASVVQVASGESWNGYFEVKAKEEITPLTIATVDASANAAWHFSRAHLFVSASVMDEISSRGIKELSFSPGFSEFAGGGITRSLHSTPR